MIRYHYEDTEALPLDRERLRAWIRQTAASHGRSVGAVNYVFCSKERMLQINREFLQHDYFTDVITFDYGTADTLSGDIFIGVETVKENAAGFGTAFEDELHRVMIHGVLHLCGLDDKLPDDRRLMTEMEDRALACL